MFFELQRLDSNVLCLTTPAHPSEPHFSEMRSRFLGQVSHELKTPLNAIIPMLEISIRQLEIMPEKWSR
jgi:signal transduction histidine kinase